jgi:hypothetical protein
MAIYGNLPNGGTPASATTSYFNNINTQVNRISGDANDAVIAYFQSITGDATTGKTLAAAVIYTAAQQNIDLMDLLSKLKALSDKNKLKSPTYSDRTNAGSKDTDIFVANAVTGGNWTTGNVNYANPGPSTVNTSISEVDAYLTMFLNLNRSGTSLLGLTNSPQTSKYVLRTILA